MSRQTLHVLLVEDNPSEARLLPKVLRQVSSVDSSWVFADRLSGAIEVASAGAPGQGTLVRVTRPGNQGEL